MSCARGGKGRSCFTMLLLRCCGWFASSWKLQRCLPVAKSRPGRWRANTLTSCSSGTARCLRGLPANPLNHISLLLPFCFPIRTLPVHRRPADQLPAACQSAELPRLTSRNLPA